jgi:Tfp pilus assembly protein FimT
MEVAVVIGITTVLAGIGWPLTSRLLDRSQLVAATDTLRAEVRAAQREARASGRVLEMRVDPSAGVYVIGPVGDAGRVRRLPDGVTFGAPDNADSDGVTFRENTARFNPRTGLQNSFGSITVRSRTGARRVTVSITGHTSIARWDGRQWQ